MPVVTVRPIRYLDAAAHRVARLASWVSPVHDAGAFWVGGGTAFWSAWRDGNSLTARLGRIELVLDVRGR